MKYDPNEYLLITEIKTVAQVSSDQCSSYDSALKVADTLSLKAITFVNYTEHLPHNDPAKKAAKELNDMIADMRKQYKDNPNVSTGYCKIKLANITKSSETIQRTIGAKPR
jgi:sugar diacid utilization regulator